MAYQQVMASVELKQETPSDVIEILKARINDQSVSRQFELDGLHPSSGLLNASWTGSIFSLCNLQRDWMAERYFLTIHSQTKNYNMIEEFLSWIAVYSDQSGVIGYLHDADVQMTMLIYFDQGKAYWVSVEEKERRKIEGPNP